MKTVCVGVCQTPVLGEIKEINPWLDRIAAEDTKSLWVFPELFLGGFDYDHKEKWADQCLEIKDIMEKFARDTGHILAGSLWCRKADKYYNTFYLFSPDSGTMELYSKLHLFLPGRENEYFTAGNKSPELFQWHDIKMGFAICHDLRYPELFLIQHAFEPDIFVLNAQWPLARIEHWLTLIKARAIENQCYILACNGMGNSALGKLAGHSCLITSWGKTEFILNEEPGMQKAILDEEVIKNDRQMFDSRQSPFFDLKFRHLDI